MEWLSDIMEQSGSKPGTLRNFFIQPPSDAERCIRWSPRFAGGPVSMLTSVWSLWVQTTIRLKPFRYKEAIWPMKQNFLAISHQDLLCTKTMPSIGTEDGYVLKIDAANGTVYGKSRSMLKSLSHQLWTSPLFLLSPVSIRFTPWISNLAKHFGSIKIPCLLV